MSKRTSTTNRHLTGWGGALLAIGLLFSVLIASTHYATAIKTSTNKPGFFFYGAMVALVLATAGSAMVAMGADDQTE